MQHAPLITIVIPCFNAAPTLAMALGAARAQTYRPIEIIAVDDCSRDDTVAVLEHLAADDLRIIRCERNGGAAAARNRAIAEAKGEYLAFLDADDGWAPDKLMRQIAMIDAHPEMVMVGCRAEVERLEGGHESVNADREPPQGPEAWRTLLHHSFFVPSVVVARTDVTRLIGGFTETMRAGEDDQDFFIRMALEGEVGFIDASLTTMYQQPGSLSIVNRSREHETLLPMILRHYRDLASRLSPAERRAILGARFGTIGRSIYPTAPWLGATLILRAVLNRHEPATNLWYLLTASPWARRLKAWLAHSASADTLART